MRGQRHACVRRTEGAREQVPKVMRLDSVCPDMLRMPWRSRSDVSTPTTKAAGIAQRKSSMLESKGCYLPPPFRGGWSQHSLGDISSSAVWS
eukprot:2502215-Rhodomonas_salina.5